jgi:ATP-dependent RNA helicase RhlE
MEMSPTGGPEAATFAGLELRDEILRAVAEERYYRPTAIQSQAIPHVLAGRDLLGLAQTGTGKTAAFALPLLQRLAEAGPRPGDRPIRALVLTPTRELASQIGDAFAAYGRHLPLRHTVIFGGVSQHAQERALRSGIDILVATPGRLVDLAGQRLVHLQRVEVFVLDEADRMLDMGFIHDVRRVIALLPTRRQTLLFSATMPAEAKALADSILLNPAVAAVTPVASTVETVQQRVCFVEPRDKRAALTALLADRSITRALVFTRTKHVANRVAQHLERAGIAADAIHGNKSQNARERALARFRRGEAPVLVATDIAARGIDVDGVSHVINFELPNVPETYVHRIGRTARAGARGTAISFCSAEERPYLKDIERLIRMSLGAVSVDFPAVQTPRRGGANADQRTTFDHQTQSRAIAARPTEGKGRAPQPASHREAEAKRGAGPFPGRRSRHRRYRPRPAAQN